MSGTTTPPAVASIGAIHAATPARPSDGLLSRISFLALLAFVATIPLEDVVHVAGAATLSKAIGFVAFGLWLTSITATERFRRPTIVHHLVALFAAWNVLSVLWSESPAVSVTQSMRIVQLVAVVWVVYDQTRTQEALCRVMSMYVVGALIASVLTIAFQHATRSSIRFGPSAESGPNSTGCMFSLGVMLVLYLLEQPSVRRWRWLYLAYIPIGSVAILLTASRTALISLVLGTAVTYARRSALTPRRIGATLAAIGVSVALTLAFVPAASLARLGTTEEEISSGTLNNRTISWSTAWDVFSDHPIVGVGAGAFKSLNTDVKDEGGRAHNVAVSIGVELGLVGTTIFWSALAIALVVVVRRRHAERMLWLAFAGVWFVAAMSLTWEIRKITWLVIGLLLTAAHTRSSTEPAAAR
jgi:O-antigen ligase